MSRTRLIVTVVLTTVITNFATRAVLMVPEAHAEGTTTSVCTFTLEKVKGDKSATQCPGGWPNRSPPAARTSS